MEKKKKMHVSLLEVYEYTHTQETTKALGNGTDEGSRDRTDEADVVKAAMEDEHGPNASQHPPNDFDL
ncbi:hypothetical protein Tco_1273802 [Tanacetum coccineum]